jgi:hypothetical protein
VQPQAGQGLGCLVDAQLAEAGCRVLHHLSQDNAGTCVSVLTLTLYADMKGRRARVTLNLDTSTYPSIRCLLLLCQAFGAIGTGVA